MAYRKKTPTGGEIGEWAFSRPSSMATIKSSQNLRNGDIVRNFESEIGIVRQTEIETSIYFFEKKKEVLVSTDSQYDYLFHPEIGHYYSNIKLGPFFCRAIVEHPNEISLIGYESSGSKLSVGSGSFWFSFFRDGDEKHFYDALDPRCREDFEYYKNCPVICLHDVGFYKMTELRGAIILGGKLVSMPSSVFGRGGRYPTPEPALTSKPHSADNIDYELGDIVECSDYFEGFVTMIDDDGYWIYSNRYNDNHINDLSHYKKSNDLRLKLRLFVNKYYRLQTNVYEFEYIKLIEKRIESNRLYIRYITVEDSTIKEIDLTHEFYYMLSIIEIGEDEYKRHPMSNF